MGYFDRVEDRVTVSLHILYTANQETWLIIVVQQCQLMACEAVSDGYSADPGDVDKRWDWCFSLFFTWGCFLEDA